MNAGDSVWYMNRAGHQLWRHLLLSSTPLPHTSTPSNSNSSANLETTPMQTTTPFLSVLSLGLELGDTLYGAAASHAGATSPRDTSTNWSSNPSYNLHSVAPVNSGVISSSLPHEHPHPPCNSKRHNSNPTPMQTTTPTPPLLSLSLLPPSTLELSS